MVGRLASDSRETLAEVLSAPELWRLPDDDGDASIAAATDALIIATTVPGATMTTLLPALCEAFGARAVVVARGNEVLAEAGEVPNDIKTRRSWLRVLVEHYAGFASSEGAWLHLCRAKAPSAATRARADLGEALVGRLSANGTTLLDIAGRPAIRAIGIRQFSVTSGL